MHKDINYTEHKEKYSENLVFFEDKTLRGETTKTIKLVQKKNQKILELENKIIKLDKKAHYDELTGLLNRHGLKENIEKNFKNGEEIKIIVFDIQNLKTINDYYGSISGDSAISKTADILKNNFRFIETKSRNKDIICRYGGDEFLIILKKSDINKELIIKRIEKINKIKDYHYGLHISLITNHTIDNYKIATEKGLTEAKGYSINL